MKHSFFKKFFVTTTAIILISLTAITIILSFFVSSFLTSDRLRILKKTCETVAEVTEVFDVNDINNIKNPYIFDALTDITDVQIFISNLHGEVYYCGCEEWDVYGICNHTTSLVPERVLKKLEKGEYSENGNLYGFFETTYFIQGMTLTNIFNEDIGYVFAFLSPTTIKSFYDKILWMFFVSAIIPLAVMFVAEYIFSYRFTKPLTLMAEASRNMAKGDFSKRIPVRGNDDISELAIAFNQMTNSLVQTESTRRSFVANVSHELKTPMTTIGGFIDGIVDGTIPKEKHNYYLGIISSEVKRLSRLVSSMLSLSKLESGELEVNKSTISLTDILFEVVVSFEKSISEKNISIIGLEDAGQISINADKDLIFQVIYNLVDNAVKFTNNGGAISFELGSQNGFANFKIKNTGEGIEESELPFVFDRFYKADRSRSKIKDSTGLGLYIVSTIIKIHEGKISVKSVKNKFTEFSILLPTK